MSLYERISDTLGWNLEKTKSYSLSELHNLIIPVSTDLAYDIVDEMVYRNRSHKKPHVW